jgi:FMN-dependent NADH-azoreductase
MSPISLKETDMATLLQLNTSLFGAAGQSSTLARNFVLAWQERNPGAAVIVRDLADEPVPHLTAARFAAFGTPPEQRTAEQRLHVAYADSLIAELERADLIVLGLPMYSFGVPSTLRAYFDHVARAGITFRYTANGPQGLLRNKKVYVFATRGGRHEGTARDTQSAFVRDFLGFIGLTAVAFVYAEGLALGTEHRVAALDEAGARIEQLAA